MLHWQAKPQETMVAACRSSKVYSVSVSATSQYLPVIAVGATGTIDENLLSRRDLLNCVDILGHCLGVEVIVGTANCQVQAYKSHFTTPTWVGSHD
jgi:phage/plasmid primase-like uncharacterized protein